MSSRPVRYRLGMTHGVPKIDSDSAPFRYPIFALLIAALVLVPVSGNAIAAPEQAAETTAKNQQTAKPGQTKKTKNFNNKLRSTTGMWLRAVPDPANGPLRVASWTNYEIVAPNPMYPASGNPMCGDGFADSSGYWAPGGVVKPWPGGGDEIAFFKNECQQSPENGGSPKYGAPFSDYAQVGMTAPGNKNFAVGTYYPTDSNSLDRRAAWNGSDYEYPSGGSSPTQNTSGRGCHAGENQIDQIDARPNNDPNQQSLLEDYECQCNTGLSGDNWSAWVDWWLAYAYEPNQPNTGNYWFADNDPAAGFGTNNLGKAPNYAVDYSACWMSKKDDMIKLQQALWLRRASWWNGLQPFVGADTYTQGPDSAKNQKMFWGWNEIPVKKKIDEPKNWGAMVIKLPPGVKKLSGMSTFSLKVLRNTLKSVMTEMGVPYNSKKKSKVVLLTDVRADTTTWVRKYKCQGFKFNKNLKIEFQKKTKKKNGYCYVRN